MANLYKNLFNDRSPHRVLMTTGDVQKKFDQEVLGLSYIVNNLSIAQATAEIIPFYADDVELRAAATQLWNEMSETNLTRMGHQSGNRLVFGYEKRIAASSESWSR